MPEMDRLLKAVNEVEHLVCEDEELLREALEALKWDSAAFIEVLQKVEPAELGWYKIPPGVLTTLGELETAARVLITKLEERLLSE